MEVEPVRDLANIKAIHRILTRWGNVREAECFVIGCNFALRVSDLMRTTVEQIQEDKIIVSGGEKKTDKYKKLPVNEHAREAITRLLTWYKEQGITPKYLFQATGNRGKGLAQPLSASWLNVKLKEAVDALAIDMNIGSHSMRKSFGYHAYEGGVDIHYLQALFNHKSPQVTLNYIGITKKTVQDIYHDFSIGI